MKFITGKWSDEETSSVVSDYQGFLDGKFTDKQLERKYNRRIKSISDKVDYIKFGPRTSKAVNPLRAVNGGKVSVIELGNLENILRRELGGRKARSIIEEAKNGERKINWPTKGKGSVKERSLPHLKRGTAVVLQPMSNGDIKVYTIDGFKQWDKGHRKGKPKG